jgi:hypothetical protein
VRWLRELRAAARGTPSDAEERELALGRQEEELRARTDVATARERALARHAAGLAARERAAAEEEERLAGLAAGLSTLREELEELRARLDEREAELASRTQPPRLELEPPAEPLHGTTGLGVVAENVGAPVTLEVAAPGSDDWGLAPGAGPRLDTRPLADGRWRVRAVAGDSASEPVEIVVDNDPPAARVVTPAAGAVLSGTVHVHANADDAASGVDWLRVERSIDDERWQPVAGETWDTTQDPNGEWLLRAVAVDRVGNAGTSEPVRVTVRNTVEPTEPVAAPAPRRPTLMDLEHLVEARSDLGPDRTEELYAILYHLRDFAEVDGTIPADFDALVEAEFGPLGA